MHPQLHKKVFIYIGKRQGDEANAQTFVLSICLKPCLLGDKQQHLNPIAYQTIQKKKKKYSPNWCHSW